ncbi:hypothetical protein FI667_g9480, partial [Globisporangium splendens]
MRELAAAAARGARGRPLPRHPLAHGAPGLVEEPPAARLLPCENLFAEGLAFVWWSNSLILLCTASVIFQWSSAVAAGRVTAQEMQRTKKFGLHHPLVFLHSVHLLGSIGGGIDVIVRGIGSADSIREYMSDMEVFLYAYRGVNLVTVAVDSIVACVVARQLRERLLSAAMTDEMKQKSVIQMTLLILCITVSLALEAIMDIPVLILGMHGAWKTLNFANFCIIKYFVPGVLLSVSFLYIMRRVEQREPARLVVPPSQSLVEFEECSVPCVWCSHHRRFHGGNGGASGGNKKKKWDPTFLSPLTVDSSFHSAHSSTHGGYPHPTIPELWPTPGNLPPASLQQDQYQFRLSVDDHQPQLRFSPETERQYQYHYQHHVQQQQYCPPYGRAPGGAPYS